MRTSMLIAAVAIISAFATANAGQIWTDGNGDGLPDGGPGLLAVPSTNLTVGVWIDAQSFSWTNFLAYIEWSGDCISYVSASYVITGGSTFPIDNFSHPRGIGFGGSGFTQGGVDHIGNAILHVESPVSCCVSPIIDIYNPYYVFSQLGAGSAYMLFTTNPGTCLGGCRVCTGACCFPDGSCVILSPSECVATGGTYLGDNSSCSECPQFEACCFCDGACQEAPVGQCPPGSIPAGPGTSCDPVPCGPPPPSACCLPDGSCVALICDQPCETIGGVRYPGQQCENVACPQPVVGACCLVSNDCIDVTEAECAAMDGFWFGLIGTCAGGFTCETRAEPQSWGRIKGLYR